MVETIDNKVSLDERAENAKISKMEMESLISDFKPFLHSRASRFSSTYSDLSDDELFSVAMFAFYEAINSYNSSKGHFFSFAERVVYNRIVDSIRKAYRSNSTLVLTLDDDDDDESNSIKTMLIDKQSMDNYSASIEKEGLIEEIEQFQRDLAEWDITMDMLVKQSPKHTEQRITYKRIVAQVLQDIDILQTIHVKHYFPVKAVAQLTGLPLKKVERARRYILATIIISSGDYNLLSNYIDGR